MKSFSRPLPQENIVWHTGLASPFSSFLFGYGKAPERDFEGEVPHSKGQRSVPLLDVFLRTFRLAKSVPLAGAQSGLKKRKKKTPSQKRRNLAPENQGCIAAMAPFKTAKRRNTPGYLLLRFKVIATSTVGSMKGPTRA